MSGKCTSAQWLVRALIQPFCVLAAEGGNGEGGSCDPAAERFDAVASHFGKPAFSRPWRKSSNCSGRSTSKPRLMKSSVEKSGHSFSSCALAASVEPCLRPDQARAGKRPGLGQFLERRCSLLAAAQRVERIASAALYHGGGNGFSRKPASIHGLFELARRASRPPICMFHSRSGVLPDWFWLSSLRACLS